VGSKGKKEGSDFVSPPSTATSGAAAAAAVEKSSIAELVIKGLLVVGT